MGPLAAWGTLQWVLLVIAVIIVVVLIILMASRKPEAEQPESIGAPGGGEEPASPAEPQQSAPEDEPTGQ